MSMGSVGKNMGFICKNRWLDLGVTLLCTVVTVYAIRADIDELVAFAVPAGIGLFRQFIPLLTFPYVASLALALMLALNWADYLPFAIGFS